MYLPKSARPTNNTSPLSYPAKKPNPTVQKPDPTQQPKRRTQPSPIKPLNLPSFAALSLPFTSLAVAPSSSLLFSFFHFSIALEMQSTAQNHPLSLIFLWDKFFSIKEKYTRRKSKNREL